LRVAAVAFLCGILLLQQCQTLPAPFWAGALLPAAALALWQPRWSFVAFLVAGFLWAGFRAGLILQQQLPPVLEARDIAVEGVVADLPQPTEYGSRFLFDVERARTAGGAVAVPRR
jgi:competence protein ComEC